MSTTALIAALTLAFGCAIPQDLEETEADETAEETQETTRTVVVETEVEIFEGITFEGDTAAIAPSSDRTLDAVARTLDGNPSITLLQVRGHTDARTDRVTRAELSHARAEAVVARLVRLGVSPDRLEPYGASDTEPVAASPTDPANSRIELIILERDAD